MANLLSKLVAKLNPAAVWNKKYRTDEWVYTKVENRFVRELCEPLEPGTAIDLGGGEGRNSMWLAKRGWTVENIDFSAVALKKFQTWVNEEAAADASLASRALATKADARGFRSQLAPVDLGVVAYLQIPEAELAKALSDLVSAIKPGGTLVGVWHSRDNLEGGFGGPRNPDVLPNVASIKKALANAPIDIAILENREGQIQTAQGLKPSTTLILKGTVRE